MMNGVKRYLKTHFLFAMVTAFGLICSLRVAAQPGALSAGKYTEDAARRMIAASQEL